jgi:hypothetical protein
MKFTKANLSKLEDLLSESGYMIRYERGNFKSGYCILKENRLVLVNNFLPLEGRINCLLELTRLLPVEAHLLTAKSLKLFQEIQKNAVELPEIPFQNEIKS